MHLRTAFDRQTLRNGLRALLVVLALLNHAVAASAHDHDGPRGAQDNLCAICVYGAGTGATVETGRCAREPAIVRTAPVPAKVASRIARPVAYTSIRAPPKSL